MPTNRNHRNDDLDDITGRRQIISPRDSQSGLPTRQVWDDTDIVHVVGAGEADVASATDMTYGDIEFDVVAPPADGQLIDTSTGEIVWADEARKQDVEVENDETHFTERSGGPRHVLGAVQKRVPGTAADGFESQTRPFADGFMDQVDDSAEVFTDENSDLSRFGADSDGAQGISEANALWQLIESEVAPDDSLPELDL